MHRPVRALALAAFALFALAAPAAAAPAIRSPRRSSAAHVPTPKSILGFDLGKKEVTTAQSDAYLGAVDGASDRVVTGDAAHVGAGPRPALRDRRPSGPRHRRRPGEPSAANAAQLMDPDTSPAEAAAIAAADPAILWIAGNVHGTEESGADAALRVLYELADREDCAARQILDAAVVVDPPDPEPGRPRGRHAPQRVRVRHEPRLVRAHPARDRRQGRGAAPLPARAVHRRPRDGQHRRLLLPPERRSRSTTRSRTPPSTGSTGSTARRCSRPSTPARSRTSTTRPTTSSTWATATPCRRRASAPPA